MSSITQEDIQKLQNFISTFGIYHDIANKVFGVSNGHEYMSEGGFAELRSQEKMLRRSLNEEFGVIEQLVYDLMGGKPFIAYPGLPGRQWDVFAEALSANFNIVKGESLNYVEDALSRAIGAAKASLNSQKTSKPEKTQLTPGVWFSDDLVSRITDHKIKTLCIELNQTSERSPNATALLMRTILLLVLQNKLGKSAKNDLKDVLNQAIAQDVYSDVHIKRILTNLSSIPKTILDASHHSKWVMVNTDEIGVWLPGLVKVVEATFV